jgi:hypothetical protein
LNEIEAERKEIKERKINELKDFYGEWFVNLNINENCSYCNFKNIITYEYLFILNKKS